MEDKKMNEEIITNKLNKKTKQELIDLVIYFKNLTDEHNQILEEYQDKVKDLKKELETSKENVSKHSKSRNHTQTENNKLRSEISLWKKVYSDLVKESAEIEPCTNCRYEDQRW